MSSLDLRLNINRVCIGLSNACQVVLVDGIEPPTNGLQNRCSTAELNQHHLIQAKALLYPDHCLSFKFAA